MRVEKDVIGEIQLPDDCLYGINTARAMDNFKLNNHKTNRNLIRAIVIVKKAAAETYVHIKDGDIKKEKAISHACDKILSEDLWDNFPLDALQGGAGTSTNMNVNEVIANLANKELGAELGDYSVVHPLNDVNRGQSTNDVYPTGLRIAAIRQLRLLSDECAKLQTALQEKENKYEFVKKLGRTELMDAVPISLGQEFGAYAQAIARDRWRLYKVEERLRQVNIGGTAVGLANLASHKYRFGIIEELRNLTGYGLASAEYPMDITQNNDVFVETSGLIKALAVNLMKISNDLRLMNSGPYGGLGEIKLKEMQQGSTIMPGKINPVIPEMVMQSAMKVISNDNAISMAAAHGEFELNAFMPLIADSILNSLELMTDAVKLFREKCIVPLEVNEDMCERHLEESYAFATEYVPVLGYDTVSAIVHDNEPKEAVKKLMELSENKND